MIERPNRREEPVSRLPATARAIGCLVTTFAPKSSSTETGLSTTTGHCTQAQMTSTDTCAAVHGRSARIFPIERLLLLLCLVVAYGRTNESL